MNDYWVALLVLLLLTLTIALAAWGIRRERLSEFEDIFGLSPFPNKEHPKNKIQLVVQKKLTILANNFFVADIHEVLTTSDYRKSALLNTLDQHLKHKAMMRSTRGLKRAKRSFWRAHNRALHQGYMVHSSYKDYLEK